MVIETSGWKDLAEQECIFPSHAHTHTSPTPAAHLELRDDMRTRKGAQALSAIQISNIQDISSVWHRISTSTSTPTSLLPVVWREWEITSKSEQRIYIQTPQKTVHPNKRANIHDMYIGYPANPPSHPPPPSSLPQNHSLTPPPPPPPTPP